MNAGDSIQTITERIICEADAELRQRIHGWFSVVNENVNLYYQVQVDADCFAKVGVILHKIEETIFKNECATNRERALSAFLKKVEEATAPTVDNTVNSTTYGVRPCPHCAGRGY